MFDLVKDAKKRLLTNQGSWADQNFDIQTLKTNRDIAVMENDIATAQYRTKYSIAEKALQELNKAADEVLALKV